MRYTTQDVIAAIKKDDFPWSKDGFFQHNDEGQIKSACVVGVAAINLGVYPAHIRFVIVKDNMYKNVLEDVYRYNDNMARSYDEAAAYAISVLEKYPDAFFEASPYDYSGRIAEPSPVG